MPGPLSSLAGSVTSSTVVPPTKSPRTDTCAVPVAVPRPAPVLAATVMTFVPKPTGTVAENAPLSSAVAVTTDEAPATSVSFINFGAFTAFTFVNLCVIALAIRRRNLRGPKAVLINLVVPLVGAAIDVWLLTNLDSRAIILGLSWLVLGILYLTYLTRGFRRPPPEMDFAEDDESTDAEPVQA